MKKANNFQIARVQPQSVAYKSVAYKKHNIKSMLCALRFSKSTQILSRKGLKKFGTCSRSSRSQIFFKKGVLINFANFIGKQLCWSLFCWPEGL